MFSDSFTCLNRVFSEVGPSTQDIETTFTSCLGVIDGGSGGGEGGDGAEGM